MTGQVLLAKGDLEQAFNAFKIVLDGDRTNVPALLGQVWSFNFLLALFVLIEMVLSGLNHFLCRAVLSSTVDAFLRRWICTRCVNLISEI